MAQGQGLGLGVTRAKKAISPLPPGSLQRITEAGNNRVTEDGKLRITEPTP